jgi:uncharacterized iron-regulated membrane protein
MTIPAPTDSRPDRPAGQIYRAFWRWHFYAGLLVLPVLMLMALTGGLYLFKTEISGVLYRSLLTVEASARIRRRRPGSPAPNSGLGGKVVQLIPPARPDQSAQMLVQRPNGEKLSAYVDPHNARLLGSTPQGGVMGTIKRLHSLDLFGTVANWLVEIVAGWAIVLVATGIFLWWPRGRAGGVVTVRGAPRQRVFWRDLHAVTGLLAGLVIVFLAATGMPWSAFWGQEVRKITTEAGLGRPKPPTGGGHHEVNAEAVPWALQGQAMDGMDMADMPGMAMDHPTLPLGVDAIVAKVDASGLPKPYVLSLPAAPGKAWSAAYMPDKVENTRTLYLDGLTGKPLADIGYGDFGPAAKAIEWGIAVHQGQQFGLANRLVMLAGCIAVWLLGISAVVMWWKRRPRGRLAAPPAPADRRAYGGLALVVVPLALLYPLVGASLVVVLTLDIALRRLVPALRPKIGV